MAQHLEEPSTQDIIQIIKKLREHPPSPPLKSEGQHIIVFAFIGKCWSRPFQFRPREQDSLSCKSFIKKTHKIFIEVRIGKSTSVLLTLRSPALGPPLSNRCYRYAGAKRKGAGDRVTERYQMANKVNYVCGAAHFNQSASTLKSGDTGLTLNFGNAWLKKDKKRLSMRNFR